jgi:hypothetical protein
MNGAVIMLLDQVRRSSQRMSEEADRSHRETGYYQPRPPVKKPFDWSWNLPIIVGSVCVALFVTLAIWLMTRS